MGEPEESDIQKAVGKPLPSTTPAEPVKPVSKPVIKSAKPVSAPDTTKRARNPKIVEKEIDAGEGTKEGKESAKRRYREGYKLLQDEQKTKGDPSIEENRPTKEPPYDPNKVSKTSAKTVPASSKTVAKGIKQLSEDSPAAKALREQRKQRLGANYAAQKKALSSAPEGPGKEALKKSVEKARRDYESSPMKRGGMVKKYASGGSVKSSASKRADGIAQRGKTRGRIY
jgi:thiol:disulfide interchange protein